MNGLKTRKIKGFCIFALVILLARCDIQEEWMLEVPSFLDKSELKEALPLTEKANYALEGIYRVVEGADMFGDTLVLKQTRDKISLFGLRNANYFIMDAGSKQNSIILEGYWRFAQNDNTGLVRLIMENAASILSGDTLSPVTLIGVYGKGSALPQQTLHLQLIERFSPKLRADPFIIGAHRGGGRTADKLPVSENSIEMIKYTEYLGSNAIEIDVALTKDKIPVLYHDEDLNIRLVQKGPIFGKIEDYTFKQLRTFVKLIHGENIPTLKEALDVVINDTKIRLVWLDVKSPEVLEYIIPMHDDYMNKLQKANRNLSILIGVPSIEVYDKLRSYPNYQTYPSICELEPDKVSAINAQAWAYRWTLGIQQDEIGKMHSEGRKCLVWTLDIPDFMEIYATHGGADSNLRFDGILTNYPSMLAYIHYVRHNF
jgi:glycerophosphoryl diester phosphodiesterase